MTRTSCGMSPAAARALSAGAVLCLLACGAASADDDPFRALRSKDAAERAAALERISVAEPATLVPRAAGLRPILRERMTRDPDGNVRGLAAAALLRLDGEAAVRQVVDAMAAERDPAAERCFAAAWRCAPPGPARRALASAVAAGTKAGADPDDIRSAALAAESFGHLPDRAGADDLAATLSGAVPWPVAAGACLGLSRIAERRAVDALVPRMSDVDPSVRAAARWSLAELTGTDRGAEAGPWEAWWKDARDGWTPRPGAEPPASAGGAAGTTGERARDRPTWSRFFGLPVRGRRVAFAVDYSQSMWGERRRRAESELLAAAKGLPPTAELSVVLFNERVWSFRGEPVPARPQELHDLSRFLPEQETKSYTAIWDACEEALGLAGVGGRRRDPAPGLEELFLLSDGVPNRGRIRDPDRIVEGLAALAAGRVKIHTVSLGPPDEVRGDTLLVRIARATGGASASSPVEK